MLMLDSRTEALDVLVGDFESGEPRERPSALGIVAKLIEARGARREEDHSPAGTIRVAAVIAASSVSTSFIIGGATFACAA